MVVEASEGSKRVLDVLGGTRVLVCQKGLGGSWRISNSLGGYRKVLGSLLWSRKVKVKRESKKVLNGLKKPGESGTVLDGLLGSGRVWKGLKWNGRFQESLIRLGGFGKVKGGLGGSEQA